MLPREEPTAQLEVQDSCHNPSDLAKDRREDGGRVRSQQIRAMAERILALRRAVEKLGGDPDINDLRFVDWAEPRRGSSRDDGESWDEISVELSQLLGVKVSRETARRWYQLP